MNKLVTMTYSFNTVAPSSPNILPYAMPIGRQGRQVGEVFAFVQHLGPAPCLTAVRGGVYGYRIFRVKSVIQSFLRMSENTCNNLSLNVLQAFITFFERKMQWDIFRKLQPKFSFWK